MPRKDETRRRLRADVNSFMFWMHLFDESQRCGQATASHTCKADVFDKHIAINSLKALVCDTSASLHLKSWDRGYYKQVLGVEASEEFLTVLRCKIVYGEAQDLYTDSDLVLIR